MATQYIERQATGSARISGNLKGDSAGNVAAFLVDADDERVKYWDRTAGLTRVLEGGVARTITPTAAVVLTAEQSGSVVFLNASAGFQITLPAKAAGLRFKFVTAAAFATTPFTIVVPAANDNTIQGYANVANVSTPAVNEGSINFVESAEVIGDWVEVINDGTNWIVSGEAQTAAAITFTT